MKVTSFELSQIKPYSNNPRLNSAAVDAVASSIDAFGFRQPIVVDSENVIICGHTRWLAAKKLGLDSVPVHVATNLSEDQVRAYRIADNQTAKLAPWDETQLAFELANLRENNFSLDLLAFDADYIAQIFNEHTDEGFTDPDAIPEPPDAPVTQRGDLWLLGDHRLLCGDSADVGDVDRLVGEGSVQLINTDPPYNVKVEPRSNNAMQTGSTSFGSKTKRRSTQKLRAKDRPLANDFLDDEAFADLLQKWFGNLSRVLEPGRSFYVWGGFSNCGNYPKPLADNDLYFSQAIIWHKQHPVITRKDFMGDHEWCQPADTRVMTPSGSSAISALRQGDRVVSFYPHNSSIVGLRNGLHAETAQRHYCGELFGVSVGERITWSTSGHIWTVRLSDDYPGRYCVYLMRRDMWWRVGVTKMRTTWGFGLKGRMLTEGGDEAWILSIHDSHADARMHEQLVSVRFGIPQTCWVESKEPTRRKMSHIQMLYDKLDLLQLNRDAESALAAFHRSRRYPFLRNTKTRSKFGTRQSIQVRACNLIPEIMEVPIAVGGQATRWQRIQHVDVQPYDGQVYSMGVERYQHYVADGIVTHNCFYGWKTGAAHSYFGPNNATDVWSIKKVAPQSMVHLTEKPVELAVRAINYSSRMGERVLDLFGGSGSTLIACEQTDRKALLMELDPMYADVIVERWQDFTGKKAKRQSIGK